MKRRNFLKGALASLALSSTSLFAQTLNKQQPNLLFVLLRGGADGLSMLVPYNDKNYYVARPTISIEKSKCLELNETFGINPALKNTYYDWYKNNEAIFIPAAGQIDNSRSHFLAQDILEYGINNSSFTKDGFLSRLQETLGVTKSISFTENTSPIFKHSKLKIPNITSKHISGQLNFPPNNKIQYENDFKDIYLNVQENIRLISKTNKNNQQQKLSNVAEFMKNGNYNIGFVDFGDWDTHSNQGSLDGSLFNLLLNLDKELLSFRSSYGEENWNNTLVVVMSEFGRTVKENGNGSDHGHGNLMSLFGGLIKKSQIVGNWTTLNEKNLHEQRDLHVFHEYRDILAEVFVKIYGLSSEEINYIFPNSKLTNFNIV